MQNRKDEHVELALKYYQSKSISDFDNVKFVYNSFSTITLDEIDIGSKIGNIVLECPFFINAMSGGSAKTKIINQKLAEVAAACNLAIAAGSLSAAIKDPTVIDTFEVIREVNPNGLVFANLGAEYSSVEAQKAIDILKADAIQIHLNPLQELIMVEGDRNFSTYLNNIKDIVNNVDKPVIVKEVGFGMSKATIETLLDLNVEIVDVSGSGGTNFAIIEDARRSENRYDYLHNFGISTVNSLIEAYAYRDEVAIIASGGIRNPLDIVKALALGAKAVGISALILQMVESVGVKKTIKNINQFKADIKKIMLLLNAKNITELLNKDIILFNEVKDWALARGINLKQFSQRTF